MVLKSLAWRTRCVSNVNHINYNFIQFKHLKCFTFRSKMFLNLSSLKMPIYHQFNGPLTMLELRFKGPTHRCFHLFYLIKTLFSWLCVYMVFDSLTLVLLVLFDLFWWEKLHVYHSYLKFGDLCNSSKAPPTFHLSRGRICHINCKHLCKCEGPSMLRAKSCQSVWEWFFPNF